jgi:hypothetical protein
MEMIDLDTEDDEAVHLGPDEKEVSVQKNAVTGIPLFVSRSTEVGGCASSSLSRPWIVAGCAGAATVIQLGNNTPTS